MPLVEWLGTFAIIVMVSAYALEKRHPSFVFIFAAGCVLAAVYAYLISSYPFLVAEGIWALIAFQRWLSVSQKNSLSQ